MLVVNCRTLALVSVPVAAGFPDGGSTLAGRGSNDCCAYTRCHSGCSCCSVVSSWPVGPKNGYVCGCTQVLSKLKYVYLTVTCHVSWFFCSRMPCVVR